MEIQKTKTEKTARVPMGINGYDKMISGGFEQNSTNLIAGGAGSGKTIFALQFLMEGLKKKEKTLFVTFEEKKEEFFSNMKSLGWDLAKAENLNKFIFLEYSPEKVKMMLDEGGGAIETLILKHKVKRLVIDSITSFTLLFDDKLSKRQALLGLMDIIRKWDCTTLLTVQHDPERKQSKELSLVEFEADSVTLLYFVKEQNERKRFLEVLKMRGTNHSKKRYSFTINKGIQVGGESNKSSTVKKTAKPKTKKTTKKKTKKK